MHILLVDDHTMFREALVHVLGELDQDVRVAHASTASEAIGAVSYYRDLDLILLNPSLAGVDGISILPQLRQSTGGTPVVVVTGSGRAHDVRRALEAGAASYVPKTASTQELLLALKMVLNGESYLPPSLLAVMAPEEDPHVSSRPVNVGLLTERQKEVLLLLSQGLSNKIIASHLDLAEGTVKLHVSAIMRALGARSRTEAVVAEQFV